MQGVSRVGVLLSDIGLRGLCWVEGEWRIPLFTLRLMPVEYTLKSFVPSRTDSMRYILSFFFISKRVSMGKERWNILTALL